MSKQAIVVKNLKVVLQGQVIIDKISFEIPEGKIAAIIGPNGSGKSTLMKAILGLLPIQAGGVMLLGESLKKVKPYLGYVPQNFRIDRSLPMTVEEFLLLSIVEPRDKAIIFQVLDEVGMADKQRSLLGNLSGGELQRVLIARALLRKPKLLFLDEPSSGIDIEGEETFYQLIHSITAKYQTTTLMISHEIEMVPQHAELVICLNKDMICFGKPHEVLTLDTLKLLYGKHAGTSHHH